MLYRLQVEAVLVGRSGEGHNARPASIRAWESDWRGCKYLGDFVQTVAHAAGYGRHDEPVPPVASRWSAHSQCGSCIEFRNLSFSLWWCLTPRPLLIRSITISRRLSHWLLPLVRVLILRRGWCWRSRRLRSIPSSSKRGIDLLLGEILRL